MMDDPIVNLRYHDAKFFDSTRYRFEFIPQSTSKAENLPEYPVRQLIITVIIMEFRA
jgi:hypothetical protein